MHEHHYVRNYSKNRFTEACLTFLHLVDIEGGEGILKNIVDHVATQFYFYVTVLTETIYIYFYIYISIYSLQSLFFLKIQHH